MTRGKSLGVPTTLVEEAESVGSIPHPSAALAGLHNHLASGVRDVGGAVNPYWHRAVASSEDRHTGSPSRASRFLLFQADIAALSIYDYPQPY